MNDHAFGLREGEMPFLRLLAAPLACSTVIYLSLLVLEFERKRLPLLVSILAVALLGAVYLPLSRSARPKWSKLHGATAICASIALLAAMLSALIEKVWEVELEFLGIASFVLFLGSALLLLLSSLAALLVNLVPYSKSRLRRPTVTPRTLLITGLALLGLGVLLFVFRADFAEAFLQARIYRRSEFYKIQIFAYAGGVSFLLGLTSAVVGLIKKK